MAYDESDRDQDRLDDAMATDHQMGLHGYEPNHDCWICQRNQEDK